MLKLIIKTKFKEFLHYKYHVTSFVTYTQGQSLEPNSREYFYYIDHQGMLFLDNARIKNFTSCFKDKQFLTFFFKRLKKNDTFRYPLFPFISPCGREKNYIRCDDCPIVFTHVSNINGIDMLCHNHASNLLSVPFEPQKIYMHPENGRVYHPCSEKTGSIGLVQSKLAIEFSQLFTFENNENVPIGFTWKRQTYKLDSKWFTSVNR